MAKDYAEGKSEHRNMEELIRARMEHEGKDYDYCAREVLADALAKILPDSNFAQELAQENMTWVEQIIDMLKKFIADIKAALKGIDPVENAPHVDIRENIGGSLQYLEEIRQMYDKLAAGAVQNYQAAMEAETQKNTTQEGSVSHSIKRTRRMTLQQQLSAYYSKDFMRSDSFYFGNTPSNLTRSGLESHPLAMMQDDFKKSTRTKHNIPRRVLKKLHSAISHPIFSFTAGKQVAIMTTEIDGDGKPVVVAIHGGHNMDRMPVNVIKSIYGVDFVAEWVGQQIDGGSKFRIYDIEKTTAMLQTEGYLAEVGAESDGSWDTITQTNVGVKGENARVSRKSRMTDADIQAVQSIGRISVNQFSSADIKATERFAQQYWEEMGVKSPFFRAWFGDWRANDQTRVQVARQKGDARGVQKNADTGWDIQVSGKVFNETGHKAKKNQGALAYLPYINDVVKKAVLLDSFGVGQGKTKSDNSLLMHSMYAVADIGNGPVLLKLFVEEMNNPNADGTTKRAYQLQNIEMQQLSAKGSSVSSSPVTSTATIRTVADLFDVVKQKDPSFQPKPASKVVNPDGTPMVVYHGTSDQFTEFKHSELSDKEGSFFFAQNREDAEAYTGNGNVMAVYVNLQNPIDYNDMPSEIYKLKDKRAQVAALRKLGYDGWICDMDTGWGEVSAFNSNQIKSATDNIGTFDGTNADIRHKRRANAESLKNSVDNSAAVEENGVTQKTTRSGQHDDGRVRKGAAKTAEDRGYNGRTVAERTENAQKSNRWEGLNRKAQSKVLKTVNDWTKTSPNVNELFEYTLALVGADDRTVTEDLYKKAVDVLAEKLYNDAVNLHPVLFEDKWKIMGGSISSLRRSLLDSATEKGETKVSGKKRGTTLSDREVLEVAALRMDTSTLTEGEKTALDIFKKRLEELRKLQIERERLGSLWHEQQFGSGDRSEAPKTLNRMQVLDGQIERAVNSVLSVEDKQVLRDVLQKAREYVKEQSVDHYRGILERRKDRSTQAQLRQKLHSTVHELSQLLLHGDKNHHVPESMKKAIAGVLILISLQIACPKRKSLETR